METNSENKYLFKRGKNNDGIGLALLLILVGAVYLLLNMDIIPQEYKPILISWQMLLIVIGIWSLAKGEFSAAVILIFIGGFFIYPKLNRLLPDFFIDLNIDFSTYWPVILIVVGIVLVLGKGFSSKKSGGKYHSIQDENYTYSSGEDSNIGDSGSAYYNESDFVDKNVFFSGSRQIILSRNFAGGEGNALFGELIVDLRKAKLARGTHKLEINVAFAGATVLVPPDMNIELRGNSIFGAFEDKRHLINEDAVDRSSRLVIKANCIFGGGEVKN